MSYLVRDHLILSYFLTVKAPVGKLMIQLLIRVPNQLIDHLLLSYFFAVKAPLRKPSYDHSFDRGHGQTLDNRTKPGPSLQVEERLCLCYLLMFLLSKTA